MAKNCNAIRSNTRFLCFSVPLWLIIFLTSSCSIPNLEAPDCTQARIHVREFYSFHFGNDMRSTLENVRLRERFLTQNYAAKLRMDAGEIPPTGIDYFTDSEEFPKTFRVGECTVIEPGKATQFQLVLFWKDDTRSEQKEIVVNAKHEQNNWLIDSVGAKP